MEKEPNIGEPSPHFDGEREGIYQDAFGKEMGVSMDGDPKKEVNQNPEDARNKGSVTMGRLNKLIQGRDQQ